MLHSRIFTEDPKYRQDNFFNAIHPSDRPLIVQFCGHDPEVIASAAEYVKDHCDAVDINLGCPQAIAKKGHYGAFLQDEWELVSSIGKTHVDSALLYGYFENWFNLLKYSWNVLPFCSETSAGKSEDPCHMQDSCVWGCGQDDSLC